MKLLTLIMLEAFKQKKGWIWFFLFIIPAGTTLAMYLDFSIRYGYLLDTAQAGFSSWDILLFENHRVLGWGLFLPMFIGMIYACLYQVEESQNNWKHLLSLSIRREELYISKYLAGIAFSMILILLNMLGLVLVGMIIGFPEAVEWSSYLTYAGKQVLMILTIASVHNWVSSYFKNMILPIVIGFAGVILSSIVLFQFPDGAKFFPYSYPFMTVELVDQGFIEVMMNNLLFMIVFLAAGMWQFKRKDVL